MSRKTNLTQQTLGNLNIFDTVPKQIIYVHKYDSSWHVEFKELKLGKVLPENWNEEIPTLIIIDDLLTNKAVLKETTNLFVRGSYHKNASIIFITQNLFYDDSNYRTMSYNTTFMTLLKSLQLQEQVEHFGRQIYGKKSLDYFLDAYSQAAITRTVI